MNAFRTRIAAVRKGNAGFTLIELLIVIVILGILAGIAIFGVSQFRQDATTACTKTNARIDVTVSAAKAVNPSGTYTSTGGSC
jgi:general secretion pathway protein G